MKNIYIENIINELVNQCPYGDSNKRPWIVGSSGGKESKIMKH
jgi:hypothetical protein